MILPLNYHCNEGCEGCNDITLQLTLPLHYTTVHDKVKLLSPGLRRGFGGDDGSRTGATRYDGSKAPTKVADIPIEWSVAGLGIIGGIEIGYQLVHSRNERRARLRESAFSYLYYAEPLA